MLFSWRKQAYNHPAPTNILEASGWSEQCICILNAKKKESTILSAKVTEKPFPAGNKSAHFFLVWSEMGNKSGLWFGKV